MAAKTKTKSGRTLISAQSDSRTSMPRPLTWPSGRGLSHALWHGRPVRLQLLIIFIVIDVIAGLVAGGVTIFQARASTRVEIAASMELAELLVSEAVGPMPQGGGAEEIFPPLTPPFGPLRPPRRGGGANPGV